MSDWRASAACIGSDIDFHSVDMFDQAAALRICAICSVREPCLETALANEEPYGIFGGKTVSEREHLLTRRARMRSCVVCLTRFLPAYGYEKTCSPACSQTRRAATKNESRARRSLA